MPTLSKGFTLIELLVAISIIVVVGTLILIDFNPFRNTQNLQIAVLDLQNFIREAQVNASSGVICPDSDRVQTVKPWKVSFTSDEVEMICGSLSAAHRTLKFKPDIKLQLNAPCSLEFTPVNGSVSFKSCDPPPDKVEVLVRFKDDPPKKLIINLGGVINVE